MLEAVVVMARPPRIQPTTEAAKSVSRREMPAWFMSAPARMNSGIATSGKESVPLKRRSGTTTSGVFVVSQIASTDAAISTYPIGIPTRMNATAAIRATRISIGADQSLGCRSSAASRRASMAAVSNAKSGRTR